MSSSALREQVASIVAAVVRGDASPQDSTDGGWDSLQQIEVVLAIEDEFGVTIDETAIPRLRSIDDVTAHLASLHASR